MQEVLIDNSQISDNAVAEVEKLVWVLFDLKAPPSLKFFTSKYMGNQLGFPNFTAKGPVDSSQSDLFISLVSSLNNILKDKILKTQNNIVYEQNRLEKLNNLKPIDLNLDNIYKEKILQLENQISELKKKMSHPL